MTQGDNLKSATKRAVEAIIGFKYLMLHDRNSVIRIPKEVGLTPADVSVAINVLRGSYSARSGNPELNAAERIGTGRFDIFTPPSDHPGLDRPESAAFRHDQAARSLRQFGAFVTTPTENGIELMYAWRLASKADGSPFRLTWDEVRELSRIPAAAAPPTNSAVFGSGRFTETRETRRPR